MGTIAAATVALAVNGKRYEAAGVDPSTTLLEFLRTQTPVRGPKLGCGEGTYVITSSDMTLPHHRSYVQACSSNFYTS
jgi:xanthine dehydrogenase iron-sulfur cluster and FAD-binding subunit A